MTQAPSSSAVAGLQFASLEPATEARYKKQAGDFLAYCEANSQQVIPCSLESLSSYLYSKFSSGCTARSNASVLSKLRWYYRSVLRQPWLTDQEQTELGRITRALGKYDYSMPKKAAPLYLEHIRRLFALVKTEEDQIIFAAFSLAHATISRLGELLHKDITVENVQFISSKRCFVFYHYRPPKAHKLKRPPYAVISYSQQRFHYFVLSNYISLRKRMQSAGCLFPSTNKSRTPLLRKTAVDWIQRSLQELKFPGHQRYSGHSPRRGAFNEARRRAPMTQIAAQGHWAPGGETAQIEYEVSSLSERLQYF